MVEQINKLTRVQREMLQELGREPTPEELAKELDMTPEKVVEIQGYAREPVSLDARVPFAVFLLSSETVALPRSPLPNPRSS